MTEMYYIANRRKKLAFLQNKTPRPEDREFLKE